METRALPIRGWRRFCRHSLPEIRRPSPRRGRKKTAELTRPYRSKHRPVPIVRHASYRAVASSIGFGIPPTALWITLAMSAIPTPRRS